MVLGGIEHRQAEGQARAAQWVGVGRHAAMVQLDDRPANRQPHAHAVGLGGVERGGQLFDAAAFQPRAVVARNYTTTRKKAQPNYSNFKRMVL